MEHGHGPGQGIRGTGSLCHPDATERVRAAAFTGPAAGRSAAARPQQPRQLPEPGLPQGAGLLCQHLRPAMGTARLGNAGLQCLGRVLQRLFRLLFLRPLEHPRIPQACAGRPSGPVGHHAAARSTRARGRDCRWFEPGAVSGLPAQGCCVEAGRVSLASGYPAALPRDDWRSAAAAFDLAHAAAGRRSAGASLRRPARAGQAHAQGAGVGAHRAGDAPDHRAGGARRQPQDAALAELDQRVDKILAKRRWMYQRDHSGAGSAGSGR